MGWLKRTIGTVFGGGKSGAGGAASAGVPEDDVFARAVELLRDGRTIDAEELVVGAARRAKERFGPHSPQYASAANDLGMVLLNVNQRERAVAAMREACAGPMPPEEQARRDRLTYLMNLGIALAAADQLDEAEKVFREGLDGRREFYGADHPGYAFGLEPLAKLLLRKGRAPEAAEMMDEVCANFATALHPRLAGALAVRAEAMRQAGRDGPAFDLLADSSEEAAALVEDTARAAIERVGEADLKASRGVLNELAPLLAEKLGQDHQTTLDVLVAISNVERLLGDEGDPKIRELAIRAALDSYERQGRDEDYVAGLMGLALLKDETGDADGATGCYRDAAGRAAEMKNPAVRSQVLRNFGLMLCSRAKKTGAADQLAEAEARLTEAVAEAARSDHVEMLGRAEIALGLFFQHGGRLGEAKPFMERGLEHLDPGHPDAVCGRSHLQAILSGSTCGCGDTPAAIADAFRDFVLGRLPPDLLKDLKVTLKDSMDFDVKVQLSREPTEQELEQLNRVINHSLEEFRRRLRSEY